MLARLLQICSREHRVLPIRFSYPTPSDQQVKSSMGERQEEGGCGSGVITLQMDYVHLQALYSQLGG